MYTFKKAISILLCGVFASPLLIDTSANAASFNNDISEMTNNNKTTKFRNCALWEYNSGESAKYSYRFSVYNIHMKYDTEGFGTSNYSKVKTESSHKICSAYAKKYNTDGSYITASIPDFEPAQYKFVNAAFPKNGTYTFVFSSTSGNTTDFDVTVDQVQNIYDSNDKNPPELTFDIPDISEYVPNQPLNVNIVSNELCRLEVGNKVYPECTGVEFPVTADGVYNVKAVDVNGNQIQKSFTIDIISKAQATTASPVTLMGDANMDGNVTIADATAILQYLGNSDVFSLSASGTANADCHSPGNGITANDALAIQMYDAKTITSLPQY
ncbi:MAG: dockerin type I repeat-containing protein [Ruminococcus sp.]|nr:dockerin type I repeat-containing protein [Ruminococcus sp.]